MPTQNLGFVKAIHVGTTPPVNQAMIWFDDNVGVKRHKVFDIGLASWIFLATNISNYALSEHLVGNNWHDGKQIYRQVFTFTPVPLAVFSTIMFASVGVIDQVIKSEIYLKSVMNSEWVNVGSMTSNWIQAIGVVESGGNTVASGVWIGSNLDVNYESGAMVVEYTKN